MILNFRSFFSTAYGASFFSAGNQTWSFLHATQPLCLFVSDSCIHLMFIFSYLNGNLFLILDAQTPKPHKSLRKKQTTSLSPYCSVLPHSSNHSWLILRVQIPQIVSLDLYGLLLCCIRNLSHASSLLSWFSVELVVAFLTPKFYE